MRNLPVLFLAIFALAPCFGQDVAKPEESSPPVVETRGEPGTAASDTGQNVGGTLGQGIGAVGQRIQEGVGRAQTEAEASLLPGAAIAPTQEPITGRQRVYWSIYSSVGLPNLGAGLFKAGFQTLVDDPEEWDTHWKGFGQRYGLRLTGNATSNVMEVGLGAIWGEDPRYRPSGKTEFKGRVWSIMKGSVMATNRDGEEVPAYARYIAVGGSNWISNSWRPDSQTTTDHTLSRIGIGFVSRMASNAFYEFWPDIKKLISRD